VQGVRAHALRFAPGSVARPPKGGVALALSIVLTLSVLPALAQPFPRFEDVTAEAGIEHRYEGEFEFMVGGGVAAFDCDDDGLPELLLAGGSAPAQLLRNRSAPGALRFEPVGGAHALDAVTGAYPLDVDADGRSDLMLLRVGENVLLRGLGDCRFERANERWGFDGAGAWSTAFAATWEAGEDWPTLAVGNYIDRDHPEAPFGGCSANTLHRPAPGGGFAPALALEPSYCALSMLITDWNRSGVSDLRISNDRQYYLRNDDRSGGEQLWRLGRPPSPYGEADGWSRLQIWGMGIASADVSGDGLPEVYLTSMTDQKLRTLDLDRVARLDEVVPIYRDIAFASGVTGHRAEHGPDAGLSATGWHAQFGDLNHDGLLDLFVAKGNVAAMAGFALADPDNLFLNAGDGTFIDGAEAAGLLGYGRGRGAAVVDLDLDGWLEVIVVNRGEPAQLWRNLGTAEGGGSVQLRLQQPGSNRDGIGSWLEVITPAGRSERELTIGGGHAGGSLGWLHLGLGEADRALVRVRWPDGGVGPWQRLDAGGLYRIERGRVEATPWP
jgi:hypothetical protein